QPRRRANPARRCRGSTRTRELSRRRRHLCQDGITPQRGLCTSPRCRATVQGRTTRGGRSATPTRPCLLAIRQRHTLRPRSRITPPRNGVAVRRRADELQTCPSQCPPFAAFRRLFSPNPLRGYWVRR